MASLVARTIALLCSIIPAFHFGSRSSHAEAQSEHSSAPVSDATDTSKLHWARVYVCSVVNSIILRGILWLPGLDSSVRATIQGYLVRLSTPRRRHSIALRSQKLSVAADPGAGDLSLFSRATTTLSTTPEDTVPHTPEQEPARLPHPLETIHFVQSLVSEVEVTHFNPFSACSSVSVHYFGSSAADTTVKEENHIRIAVVPQEPEAKFLWPAENTIHESSVWSSVAKKTEDTPTRADPVLPPSYHSPMGMASWSSTPPLWDAVGVRSHSRTTAGDSGSNSVVSESESDSSYSQSQPDDVEGKCGSCVDDFKDVETRRTGSIELKPKKFLGTLGRGAFGDVLLGRLDCGTLVAVKVTHKPMVYRVPGSRKVLLLEHEILRVAALKRLQFVTPLVSSWEDEENVYFTMPVYPETLRQLQGNQDRLPDEEIKLCAAELICGLKELHDARIMHRDIKPENILISPEGHMTFADFGLSFTDSRKSVPFRSVKAYDLVGTPGYFAPEVIARDMRRMGYTPAADIFSLGLIFLELFGRLDDAYWHATSDYNQAQLMDKKALFLDDFVESENARDLLTKMLDRDPDYRVSIGQIMEHPYFSGINWDSVRERKEMHYSRPSFHGPADEDVHLEFRSFHYPPPDAPSSDEYGHCDLTPWGKVIPNEDAREQMAESADPSHRWDFYHELGAPGADHGEVEWDPLEDKNKVREFLKLYYGREI